MKNVCISAEWDRGPDDKGHGKVWCTQCLFHLGLHWYDLPFGNRRSLRAMGKSRGRTGSRGSGYGTLKQTEHIQKSMRSDRCIRECLGSLMSLQGHPRLSLTIMLTGKSFCGLEESKYNFYSEEW